MAKEMLGSSFRSPTIITSNIIPDVFTIYGHIVYGKNNNTPYAKCHHIYKMHNHIHIYSMSAYINTSNMILRMITLNIYRHTVKVKSNCAQHHAWCLHFYSVSVYVKILGKVLCTITFHFYSVSVYVKILGKV
jgi:hypothetical protein